VIAAEQAVNPGAVQVTAGVPMPSARGNHAGGIVGGKVVVAGGTAWNAERTTKSWLADSLVFDERQWKPGPALPHAVSEPAFASDAGGLYVAGGRRGGGAETNDAVYRLSSIDGQLRWNELPKLPTSVTAGAGDIIAGRLYVVCGSINDAPSNRVFALDVSKPQAEWVEIKALPGAPRMYPAVAACGGSLCVLGGMRTVEDAQGNRGLEVFRDVYRYDPKVDEWERLPDLPAGGYCWVAGAIDDKSLLLTGRADGAIHDDVWRVYLPDVRVQGEGRTVIPTTCAPLVRVDDYTWWLMGGEPDSNKTRTNKVSVIARSGALGRARS
jgi:N-acetylneuraminic acid mutarotase